MEFEKVTIFYKSFFEYFVYKNVFIVIVNILKQKNIFFQKLKTTEIIRG